MGRTYRLVVALVVIGMFALAGCSNVGKPTPYRADYDQVWSGYGSRVSELGENKFSIYNHASPISPAQLPADHNLLRAAQLAKEKGFSAFRIVEDKRGKQVGFVSVGGMGGSVNKPHALLVVELVDEEPNPPLVLSADDVIARLGPLYLK